MTHKASFSEWRLLAILFALGVTAPAVLATDVHTISGRSAPGYVDGNTFNVAFYNTPAGLALESTGNNLYVADQNNNAIRRLDLVNGQTYTFVFPGMISKPVGVSITGTWNDNSLITYVLSRGNGTNNGTVLSFDAFGDFIETNAYKLANPTSLASDIAGNLYVTVNSNKIIKISPFIIVTNITVNPTNALLLITNIFTATTDPTNVSTVATINIAGTSLQGIVARHNGQLAVSDWGRNGIFNVDPTTGLFSTNAGFHGQGDFPTNGVDKVAGTSAKFFHPSGLIETGDGRLVVTDTGNHRVKVIVNDSFGTVSNLYGVYSNFWTAASSPGYNDGTVKIPDSLAGNVQAKLPNGIVQGVDGTIYTSEDGYHTIRKVTSSGLALPLPPPPTAPFTLTATVVGNVINLAWSASTGSTNYNVKRAPSANGPFTTIASTGGTSYSDSTVSPGTTRYYVVTALNNGGESANSMVVSATPPFLPVPDPEIGYVTYDGLNLDRSIFHPVTSSITLNNAADIVILATFGSQSFFTVSNTDNINNVPDPTTSDKQAPVGYEDNLVQSDVQPFVVSTVLPSLSIKAVGIQTNHPNSAVTSAQILFVAANPLITGDNSALFTISDFTKNAQIFYTLDGTDPSPTNSSSVDLGLLTGTNAVWAVSFGIQTQTVFKARAFRDNFQPSSIVTNIFTVAAFQPSTISFGFAFNEASSDFIASPGQTFYAPVTLTTVGTAAIYSMQFNVMVTNGTVNPGPPITPNSFGFQSMLEKPIPGVSPTIYESIIPAMFANNLVAVPNPVNVDGSTNFSGLLTTNTGLNLLGVGWVERAGETNLYDTTKQTLVTFSQAHDTIFNSSDHKVIVGGFNVRIPPTAQSNQTYTIQIGRPSATSDGIGAQGSDVFISAPTNGGTIGGTINALKTITVGQRRYIAGSVYPFRWFNAGDFGSSNIVNADVEQVFQAAVYFLNQPPAGSDFFDAMDSSGFVGALDSNPADLNYGYYTNTQASVARNPLFNGTGSDTTINQDAFGNGILDVSDVYVTFRRSLDPSLTWYRRFWNNGTRVADNGAQNVASHALIKNNGTLVTKTLTLTSNLTLPQVNFTASDIIGNAGQTVQIPITATVLGDYPLRVLMLNLTVTPADGSPALSIPVSFNQTATVLGSPYTTSSRGNGNFAAVWLNSTNNGLTGTTVIGTLSVTLPATAEQSAAYTVHFDHASASPNGLASFPNSVLTGIITTANRTNSSYGDGIPDSWRLRWFGSTNNWLSQSNADACGDGIKNWNKYIAGVDPTVQGSFPKLNPRAIIPMGYNAAIHWPTVNGKKYVIERSSQLYSGPWTTIITNTGTGGDMEFDDSNSGTSKFYRVLIVP